MTATVDHKTREEEPTTGRGRRRSPLIPLIAGMLLIAGGLIVAGYGFFHLVVTDAIAARAQDDLAADFDVRVTTALPQVHRGDYVAMLEGSDTEDAPTVSSGRFDNDDDVPVMIVPGDPSGLDPLVPDAGLPWTYETAPPQGDPVGRITIESAGIDWIVVEGVTQEDLRKGPGHMPHTPLPGQMGNAVISGHRTTYGAPFFHLDAVEAGDEIVVETVIGTHTFEVIESRIVLPTDVWVTEQWEGSWLTLTTCNPRYSARERLIVFAKLVDGPNHASLEAQFDGAYVVPVPEEA